MTCTPRTTLRQIQLTTESKLLREQEIVFDVRGRWGDGEMGLIFDLPLEHFPLEHFQSSLFLIPYSIRRVNPLPNFLLKPSKRRADFPSARLQIIFFFIKRH